MDEIKQEEIKQEEKVEIQQPSYDLDLIKEINLKLDNLTKENQLLKEEVVNLKKMPPVEQTPPKKIERSLKFIKEIF